MDFFSAVGWNGTVSLLWGAGVTLLLTIIAVIGGTLIGTVLGLIRGISGPVIALPVVFVTDALKSVPLIIQLILANSAQAAFRLGMNPFMVSCAVLILYTAAYQSEIVAGGYREVPANLRRASRSLGLTFWQDVTYIVFPLATRLVFPAWIGLVLGVMKDTALVYSIGVIELMRSGQIIITRIQEPIIILTIVGVLYYLLSLPIAWAGGRVQQRWVRND
ncbi:amino acid ABC transporter permease (plasmid) [Agrobacterium leguminum]|uniref:Amino acid ABC transporter permease protein n=2 Tax=Agrobacterium deltaense TaxID=1183412 RepID=A0A1S7UAE8_9HYPH|nr:MULTISPECIES: amino acid ABC transporter permease [Agrobacterium]WFS70111.1 amino acid ABC transporter permease [Agrobacterium leguminum]CVI63541.1 putative amino acid ABC transporter permease protein [Agrobacterium deltaense NCPPB 1641]